MKVQRALLSVHDKAGVVDLARALAGFGVEILSTGGTARLLRESGVTVREVADVTGFPEMLDGRVKTLHPRIHGGILARRDRPEHLTALRQHGIDPIDLVVSGLYPFEATVARPGVSRDEVIEQIDIGGPALIRAAAKNHAGVAVVTHPSQYAGVLAELSATGGQLGEDTRVRLAQDAFRRTAEYDAAIAAFLAADRESSAFAESLRVDARRVTTLRYGENPHQSAAFYRMTGEVPWGLAALEQLHGPELSYNNLLDFSAALALLVELEAPAAVVIKHTNPCGVAIGSTVGEAMAKAKASDPVSIYGGIVGVNRPLDMPVVQALAGIFVEILFAPAYTEEALGELRRTKRKVRLFRLPCEATEWPAQRVELRTRPRRAAGSDDRPAPGRRTAAQNGDAAGTLRTRAGRPRSRLAGSQAHQVQRHCAGPTGPGHRRGGGTDEPCGFGPAGRVAGSGGRPGHERCCLCIRRVLSVPGCPRRRGPGGGHRGDPSGRFAP